MSPISAVETHPAEAPVANSRSPFRRWLCGTLLLTVTLSLAFLLTNIKLDMFGLQGASNIRIRTLQRFSLYLMTYRFIPANFDGLLIGNSAAAGYDTSGIRNYRVFNASMRGASATEERILAEQVLRRGHLKVMIMVLNPHMTAQQGEVTAYMTPHDYIASFGSMQTIIVGLQGLLARFGHPGPVTYNDSGQTRFPLKTFSGPFVPYSREQLTIDPRELKDLRELLAEAHARHVKVYVLFFGPMYQPKWDAQKDLLVAWQSKIQAYLSHDDTVITIPDGLLKRLQARRENFPDYVHMTASTRESVMKAIEQSIDGKR